METTYRNIWKITYPVLLSLCIEQLIGITDTAFLGHWGDTALAASALAGVCYLIFYVTGSGFGVGLQVLIARLNGEKKQEEIQKIFFTGVVFLMLLAFAMIVLSGIALPYLLKYFISSDEVYKQVMLYLKWRLYGLFFSFLIVAFRAYLIGITRTKILAVSSLVMVIANIILNYMFIFGKCGFPAMGISGAAIGSTIAEAVSAMVLIIYGRFYITDKIVLGWQYLKRILNLSIWTMLQSFFSLITWLVFFIIIEHMGEQALAASNIIRSISGVPFMIVIAFASTASSLVGNLLGESKKSLIKKPLIKITVLCYGFCALIMAAGFFMPSLLLHVYTGDERLIGITVMPMYVLLSSYLVTVPAYMFYYTVSGTGNTFPSLIIGILSLVIYVLYIEWVACYKPDLVLIWFSEYVYSICLLVFSIIYLRSFNWRKKRV